MFGNLFEIGENEMQSRVNNKKKNFFVPTKRRKKDIFRGVYKDFVFIPKCQNFNGFSDSQMKKISNFNERQTRIAFLFNSSSEFSSLECTKFDHTNVLVQLFVVKWVHDKKIESCDQMKNCI